MDDPREFIRLQATVGGMSGGGGEVYTVLGEVDMRSGLLLIDMAVKVKAGSTERRHADCAAVTNNPAAQHRDALFTETDIRDAIGDYFDFEGRGLLELDEKVGQFNPKSAIELDGLDDRGRKYRLGMDMTNGKLAVIVLCWFAKRQMQVEQTAESFDEYDGLDEVVTIGISGGGRSGVSLGLDGWPE